MRFGWTDEEKEKYFIKAEQQIEAAGFTDFLKIDKTSFGVQGQKMKYFSRRFTGQATRKVVGGKEKHAEPA